MPTQPHISFHQDPDGGLWMSAKFSNEFEMSVARGSQLAMLSTIVEAIAARYVEEKFADIVAKIDGDAIATAVVEEIKKRVVNAMGIVENPEEKRKHQYVTAFMISSGICPECGEDFKHNTDWSAFPALNPEKAESMRERNIDFNTGHKRTCLWDGAR
jgi:hypothetical protein